MKIIVGLGNPGKKYQSTRHNLGFWFLDKARTQFKFGVWQKNSRFNCTLADGFLGEEKIILARPQSFMNNSGQAVAKLVSYYKINPEQDLLVVYDDLDLPLGTFRPSGKSAAGHKGMRSIIDYLKTDNLPRFRIGIKTDYIKDAANYVLQNLTAKEKSAINKIKINFFEYLETFAGKK